MKNSNRAYILAILLLFSYFNFLKSQEENPLIRFGLIADIQYCDCEPRINRFYRQSLEKLDTCIADLNSKNVQFTVNLGDLIDRAPEDLTPILLRLNKLNKKVYNTTGNHDYHGFTDNKVLYKRLNMPADYYAFKKKGWRFIVLNTNDIASYSKIKGTPKEEELTCMHKRILSENRKNGQEWNGGIGKKQMDWLQTQLDNAQKKNENVIIFTHHPIYAAEGLTALNDHEILDLLTQYSCIKVIFSGHHHEGAFGEYKNIPFVTIEGMVETETNAYGIVDIYSDKIILTGKGRSRSYLFNL